MQILTQARGFDLTTKVREHIERRLRFAFDRAHPYVNRISVVLSDVNGPRGGEDKSCRIRVSVVGAADVLIDDCQSDISVAIDRAVDRAGRTLARRLARQREYQHGYPDDRRTAISANAVAGEVACQAVPQL
ncbi:MAG TPA: 30S ribosomal protein S30 [Candidatus Accumulibacter sp.]|nr:30S ribosomal protein S30 [Accumulibacter sp.]